MLLNEARNKYLGKMVKHTSKAYLFFIINVYVFEGVIKAGFQHPYYRYIPKGKPLNATLEDLESNWTIIG